MNNTTISEVKREISHSIKSIDIATDGLRRRFESKIPDIKEEEELCEEIMEYVYESNLSVLLSNHSDLRDITIDDIKLECWSFDKDNNTYYALDLDYYYIGMESCRYTLIIGGSHHGDLIIHDDHPDNANYNSGDIVIKLPQCLYSEYPDFPVLIASINHVRNMIQDHFDRWLPIKKEIKIKRRNFKAFVERFRVNAMHDIYKQLDQYYAFIIGYNDESRKLYYAIYSNNNRILDDIQDRLRGPNLDDQCIDQLVDLRETIENVQRKMKEWFENGQKCLYHVCAQHNIPNEINKQIMCFV